MRHFMFQYKFKKRKLIAALTVVALTSGCTSNFMVSDVVSLAATDKTVGDHAISILTNKDCSTVRTELGMTYCKEDDYQRQPIAKTYCYKELGKVTCYEQADLHSVRRTIEDKTEAPRAWKRNQLLQP